MERRITRRLDVVGTYPQRGERCAVVGAVDLRTVRVGRCPVRPLNAEQVDDVGDDRGHRGTLGRVELGDEGPPFDPEPAHQSPDRCIVAQSPNPCIACTSTSMRSRLPVDTTARPSSWT